MTDEEKIEKAANQYGIYSAPINDREARVQLAVDFEAGVQWRDKNPGPIVLALVEALKLFVGYCTDEFAPTPMKMGRKALAEWEKDLT